jgi:hypothetical protein
MASADEEFALQITALVFVDVTRDVSVLCWATSDRSRETSVRGGERPAREFCPLAGEHVTGLDNGVKSWTAHKRLASDQQLTPESRHALT